MNLALQGPRKKAEDWVGLKIRILDFETFQNYSN